MTNVIPSKPFPFQVDKARKENKKKESHLLVEQIIKEEMTAEQLQNQTADSDDDGTPNFVTLKS